MKCNCGNGMIKLVYDDGHEEYLCSKCNNYRPQPEADMPMQIPDVIGCDSGWIKCSDRFPENWQIVLAYNPISGVNQAEYCKGRGTNGFTLLAWGDKSGTWFPNVTHWMPLPEPPNHGR